jgi:D-alanyl-D-alanine carboxypeptidase/D-alanyl-D-alanine-endopeptidase (penicillin-binding protein 4)
VRARLAALVLPFAFAVAAGAAEPRYQRLARETVGADQGVFVRAEDGTVLASVAADRAVHPASVTKVASTLALLEQLGPDHRFATRLLAGGSLRDGQIAGDLLVQPGGDPFLVSENAILMLATLRCIGVREVAGRARIAGKQELMFNWRPDPSGRAFAADLAGTAPSSAWVAVADTEAGLIDRGRGSIGLRFHRRAVAADPSPKPLVEHRSAPLLRVLKELNGFSNNIFHPLTRRIGGPGEVGQSARAVVAPELRDEIRLDNGAGAGTTNRLSPRAAVALIDALAAYLARHDLDLADVLPVAGVDAGTLARRFVAPDLRGVVVGKTGTYGSLGASALAGVLRTRTYGVVTFAILNRGLSVPEARRRQDAFVTAMLHDAGGVPWPYQKADEPPFAEAEVKALVGDASCGVPRPAKSKVRSAGGPKAPLAPSERRNAGEDRTGAGPDDR